MSQFVYAWTIHSLLIFVPLSSLIAAPFLGKPFVTDKWIACTVFAVFITFACIIPRKEIRIPKLSYLKLGVIGLAICLAMVGVSRSFSALMPLSSLVCFCFFLLFFWQVKDLLTFFDRFGFAFICCGLLNLFIHYFKYPYILGRGAFFGHPSILAQFLGLTILIAAHFCKQAVWKSVKVSYALIGLTLYLAVIHLGSRSVILSVALAVFLVYIVLPYVGLPKAKTQFNYKMVLSAVVVGLAVSVLITWRFVFAEYPLENKLGNLYFRYELALTSFAILRDNFWGIGFENFHFAQIPYGRYFEIYFKPHLLTATPHNEFIRMAVEFGLPFGLLFLGGYFYIWIQPWQKMKSQTPLQPFLRAFSIFFLVETLFHFPMVIPSTMLVVAFCLASLTNEYRVLRFPLLFKFSLGICSFALLLSVSLVASAYFLSRFPGASSDVLAASCRVYPGARRACQRVGVIALNQKKYSQAEAIFLRLLQTQPYNYFAIEKLAKVYYETNRLGRACHALYSWGWLFPYERIDMLRFCPKDLVEKLKKLGPITNYHPKEKS